MARGFLPNLLRLLRGKAHLSPSLADNPLLLALVRRRSVRSFTSREIPDDIWSAILEAGRLAPSTVNLQSWSFVLFTGATWQESFERPIPFHAPSGLILLGDTHRNRQVLEAFPIAPLVEYTIAVMNASLAAMAMNIAAEALGVSSVMLSETGRSGLLDAGYLKMKLALPPSVYPLMTILFGYSAAPNPPMPPKLPLEAIAFPGSYRETERAVMEDWLAQMKAGYKASHLFRTSFEDQLAVYRSKIHQAEHDLEEMVFGEKAASRLQEPGE
ncbi:MAG: nitroreductase family protein [Coprothermobacterota bacterium]|nr:nitroreductase family protein [Coprothermobacterota bacterium]